jgi:hypothetical protein
MSYRNQDNIYPEGTILSAKISPSVKLKVMSYNQRIYYCCVVGQEDKRPLAYFERELMPPQATEKLELSTKNLNGK